MKKITRDLPCLPVIDGKPTMFKFSGQDVGPFFIHTAAPDPQNIVMLGDWCVTHIATGHSVCKSLPTNKAALRVARKLAELNCWDFTEAADTKLIPINTRMAARAIVEAA